MENIVLCNVGKKIRKRFLNGEISESNVLKIYNQNKKEAENFSAFGFKAAELSFMMRTCHNPLLKLKLEECIKIKNEKSVKSSDQNKLSLEKFDYFKENALGVGLRKVISVMKHNARMSKDINLKITTLLLETEVANLSAKNHGKQLKNKIYERKDILLKKLGDLLYDSDWRYGFNDNCGKNANFVVYVYLPNGEQLSWHCNDFETSAFFPYIECEWDGKVASSLEKIVAYIQSNYGRFFLN